MELCLDNPREGFADLFATHPSVDSRVQALVKFAGGHDPGPLALPSQPTGRGRTTGSRIRPTEPAAALPPAPGATPRSPADTSRGAAPRPLGNPAGPWGRR